MTNNEVEYEALIAGMRMTKILEVKHIEVRCDSMLVVSQINKKISCKDDRIAAYVQLVLTLKKKFNSCSFTQVFRSDNNHADAPAH